MTGKITAIENVDGRVAGKDYGGNGPVRRGLQYYDTSGSSDADLVTYTYIEPVPYMIYDSRERQ